MRIFKTDEATREIALAVAGKLERDWLIAPGQPDAPTNAAALAVVNFAFEDAVSKSPGHLAGMCRAGRRGKVKNYQSVAKVDRKSTRLNSSHITISYAVFC